MQALGLKFDIILSSPYVRARQTAEIVAQTYKIKNNSIHLTNNLLPPATVERLLQEIGDVSLFSKNRETSPINVLLVGHEPHLTEMISSLLKSKRALPIDFKKGGLCCLNIEESLDGVGATLNWLLTSTQLGLMSGGAKEK
jgi:phosphohistidine phosphatase